MLVIPTTPYNPPPPLNLLFARVSPQSRDSASMDARE